MKKSKCKIIGAQIYLPKKILGFKIDPELTQDSCVEWLIFPERKVNVNRHEYCLTVSSD